jgi:hypothetical protein
MLKLKMYFLASFLFFSSHTLQAQFFTSQRVVAGFSYLLVCVLTTLNGAVETSNATLIDQTRDTLNHCLDAQRVLSNDRARIERRARSGSYQNTAHILLSQRHSISLLEQPTETLEVFLWQICQAGFEWQLYFGGKSELYDFAANLLGILEARRMSEERGF